MPRMSIPRWRFGIGSAHDPQHAQVYRRKSKGILALLFCTLLSIHLRPSGCCSLTCPLLSFLPPFLLYLASSVPKLYIPLIVGNEVLNYNGSFPFYLSISHVEKLSLTWLITLFTFKLCAFSLSVTSAMNCWDTYPCFQIAALHSFPRWGMDAFGLLSIRLRPRLLKWIETMEGPLCPLQEWKPGTILWSHQRWAYGLMEMAKYSFQGSQHGGSEPLILWIIYVLLNLLILLGLV